MPKTLPNAAMEALMEIFSGRAHRGADRSDLRGKATSVEPVYGFHGNALLFYAGLAVISALAIWLFWPTTSVGFLLDDYLHVGYLNDAVHGQPAELLKRMYSVWSMTTDSLSAYRPGLTLSFWLDYAVWNGQAFGMHLTNVLLTAISCVFVSLISVELSIAFSLERRYLTAFGAGLLFALYPLHPEATGWIAGRADVFSSLLYLVSVWGFLRFRRTESRITFIVSLIAFFVSLTMKEMPATLPLAITLAAFIVYPGTKLVHIAAYWGVLAIFTVLRTAAIGQVVGGYGDVGGIGVKQIIRNYMDKGSFLKLLYGVTEELPVPGHFEKCNYFALSLSAVLGFAAAVTNIRAARLLAFLVLWTGVTLIPAFQIWHIFPNLVGSRMFWIGSAPFCMLISFAALACADRLPKNALRLPVGVLAVTLLSTVWFHLLLINLVPWVVTGQHMANLRAQVQTLAAQTPAGKRVLLANIPQDYKGVPALGRPEFLERICRQPFLNEDLSSHVLTAQRPLAGGHEFAYPHLLKQLRSETTDTYVWDETKGQYAPLRYAGLKEPLSVVFEAPTNSQMTWEPPVEFSSGDSWSRYGNSAGTVTTDCTEVHVGRQGLNVWMPVPSTGIDPSSITAVELETGCGKEFISTGGHEPALIWVSNANSAVQTTPIAFNNSGTFSYLPAKSRVWTLASSIARIGFSLPAGDYFIKLKQARLLQRASVEPVVAVGLLPENVAESAHEHWVTKVDGRSVISFDASAVAGATKVRVFITKPWHALPDYPGVEPDKKTLAWTADIGSSKGEIALDKTVLKQSGVHQICILPLDSDGKACGVHSEPRSILVTLK